MSRGRQWNGIKTGSLAESDILVLGVPFDGAVSRAYGAAVGPARIRDLSKKNISFSEEGVDLCDLTIYDQGDVPVDRDWSHYYGEVEKQAAVLMQTGKFSLFLGGDHSITIPVSNAFARHYHHDSVGMIHLDAHCDLMDIYNGQRWSHACPQRRFLEHDNASPENLVLIGIRYYEAEELAFLREKPAISVVGAGDFFREGHSGTMKKIYKAMRGAGAIYLSIDIDVLDPAYAPGTGTPEAGGLSTRQLIELVREVMVSLPVKAVDLVEVAPPLDHSDITSRAALKIICEIFAALVPSKA